ncbi:MAG: AMP-dependent synthetase [Spirochaetae bacterium HGW-Spirochaetae-1]|jgi:crotonobetaine/carnitine-CoA ligase|nr:MAG: AMP-dependent synthetase [Spirochaetae bacterium HGW-Spirochaetae-1]
MNRLTIGKIRMMKNMMRSITIFLIKEFRRGTLRANIRGIKKMELQEEMSWGELIEEQARKYGEKTFLIFEKETYSYEDMDKNANRMANFFLSLKGEKGKGVALFMENSPRFLDVFIGLQKIGMYSVPVNTSLKGDSLLYILNHCDAQYLVIDDIYLDLLLKIIDRFENIKTIIVNKTSHNIQETSGKYYSLQEAYGMSSVNPETGYNKEDICFITYTSGTTGLPKGVVYRYKKTPVKSLSLVAYMLFRKKDILYTAMKLFHGNALFVTTTCAMCAGSTVVLSRKFSASRFWDDIRKYKITSFNTIGAMIPMLMKQPETPLDRKNNVRFIISAACPANLWEQFEKRFGLTIYEAYGAVDGGGKIILNLGTAPVGSIGKPPMKVIHRLVDSGMNDVPLGAEGELVFAAPKNTGKGSSVEYYKNEKASSEKSDSEWIFTGDIMKKDEKGYLYFVGRNTESMRIKGENVSAFEVEQALQKHPHVMEAAVYAVPSELAEDDIMASITLVEGQKISERDILEFIKDNLPKFAVPRYVKIVDEFAKTETFRIKKKEIESMGIVPGTYDSQQNAFR